MHISQRLKAVAQCDLIADIGTDHAYIPVYLIKKGTVKRAIGSDISKGSIEKARSNAEKFGCSDLIDLRCGNGLEIINKYDSPECIIIAGMGGMLAIEVMKKNISAVKAVKRLILQPQRDIDKVRIFLHKIGIKILYEKMIKEDKFYTIIVCEQGKDCDYTKYDYWFGKNNIEEKNPILKEYISCEMNKMNRILLSLENNEKQHIIKRKKEIEKKYKAYEEVLMWLSK